VLDFDGLNGVTGTPELLAAPALRKRLKAAA